MQINRQTEFDGQNDDRWTTDIKINLNEMTVRTVYHAKSYKHNQWNMSQYVFCEIGAITCLNMCLSNFFVSKVVLRLQNHQWNIQKSIVFGIVYSFKNL